MPARPRYKLNANIQDNICKFIALGVSQEAAAVQEGIGAETFYGWMRRGRAALSSALETGARIAAADRQFVELVEAIEQAHGKAEAGYTLKIAKHADRDWRAAAWWLEKRRPQHYGQRSTAQLDQPPAEMSNAELIAELNELGFVQASVIQAANDSVPAALTSGHDSRESDADADGEVIDGEQRAG